MSRYIESGFAAPQDGGRELVFHQLSQDEFQFRAANLEMYRKRFGKLTDAVIQKRRTHLERMSHAHAVHFRENVVREVILPIESQMPVEFGSPGDSIDQPGQRLPFRIQHQPFLPILEERSAPKHGPL